MELYVREKYLSKIRGFYHDVETIKVITGVRRCGKSCLMQMIQNELLDSGIAASNILKLDLDKIPYSKIETPDELERQISSMSRASGVKYLFIDEIQNVKGYEKMINSFRESGDYSIFITGSNSYLLSGELMTKLTGRYIEFELFPLSFDEYLDMKKLYNQEVNSNLAIELANYIQEGGFPKTVQYGNLPDKRTYVKSVVKEIFTKDIKRRVKIKNVEVFDMVQSFVINNFGSTFSVRSLREALERNGIYVKEETLSKYIKALLDSKILYACNRFDMKSKKSLSGQKKYYLADPSFYFATSTDNRINYGPALENMIYIYARSLDYSVSVGRIGRLECDFILRDNALNYSYVQVAYTINESKSAEDREYAPLEKIKDNYPKYVATVDYLLQKRNGITHINLLEFMKGCKRF